MGRDGVKPEALGEVIWRRRPAERLLEAAALQGDPEFVEQRFALAHGGEVTGEEPLEQIEIALFAGDAGAGDVDAFIAEGRVGQRGDEALQRRVAVVLDVEGDDFGGERRRGLAGGPGGEVVGLGGIRAGGGQRALAQAEPGGLERDRALEQVAGRIGFTAIEGGDAEEKGAEPGLGGGLEGGDPEVGHREIRRESQRGSQARTDRWWRGHPSNRQAVRW